MDLALLFEHLDKPVLEVKLLVSYVNQESSSFV